MQAHSERFWVQWNVCMSIAFSAILQNISSARYRGVEALLVPPRSASHPPFALQSSILVCSRSIGIVFTTRDLASACRVR